MRHKVLPFSLAAFALAAASPALAGPYDKVFFVRKGATSAELFADRDACTDIAKGVQIGRGEAYSDPEYGLLSAMGTAIDSDSMHGGIGKAVQRAALEKCMERRGWVQQDPSDDDEKAVRKASARNPGALDAWLKAHEPAAAQTTVATSAPTAATAPATAGSPAAAPQAAAPAQTPPAAAVAPAAPAGASTPSATEQPHP